jgi:hypothetical protein
MKRATLLAASAAFAFGTVASFGYASPAMPAVQKTHTLNSAAAMQHHIENLHKYGGPKANPGKINQGAVSSAGVNAVANFDVEPCGNGKKPIPGVGPIPGGANGGAAAMNDPERCGTRVPRIPGGVPTPR